MICILFFNTNKEKVEERLKGLKYSNKGISKVFKIVDDYKDDFSVYEIRKLIFNLGYEDALNIIKTNNIITGNKSMEKKLYELYKDDIPNNKRESVIEANDIKHLGVKEGKVIGTILSCIYDEILKENLSNSKEEIKKYIELTY